MAHSNSVSRESGQGTMELALSLPLFVLLVVGGAELANLTWASVQVNNAARAAAAFASISRTNGADLTDLRTAAQNEAPGLITSPSTQVTATQVCTCVSNTGTAGTADPGCSNTSTQAGSCPSPSVIQVTVQVNVSATVNTLVHYPGLPSSYTVHAQATVGEEQ